MNDYISYIWPNIIKLFKEIRRIPLFLSTIEKNDFKPTNWEYKVASVYSLSFNHTDSYLYHDTSKLVLSCCDGRKLTLETKEEYISHCAKFIDYFTSEYKINLTYQLNEDTTITYNIRLDEKETCNYTNLQFNKNNIVGIIYKHLGTTRNILQDLKENQDELHDMIIDSLKRETFDEEEIDVFIKKIDESIKEYYDKEDKIISDVMYKGGNKH